MCGAGILVRLALRLPRPGSDRFAHTQKHLKSISTVLTSTRHDQWCSRSIRPPVSALNVATLEPGDAEHATLAIHSIFHRSRWCFQEHRLGLTPRSRPRKTRRRLRHRLPPPRRRSRLRTLRQSKPPLRLLALSAPADECCQLAARPRSSSTSRFLSDKAYTPLEQIALWVVLLIAVAGLVYAIALVGQVYGADEGTEKMREVGAAIRQGANAYLGRQFRAIIVLVFVLTAVVYFTAEAAGAVAIGRAGAFFIGASFSWLVGFVGMRLAVRGNLRVAAAARTSYGAALQLGYRTGTITGMLTDGLGLLGGTIIFMAYGEHAYEVLLGFGFGGTLLALFMRVGGGIYTKAADVGADLVGKVEAGIPEDDPRNAATIADNVGDNVGDCAGMAADIFESYEVTIVAAMILGYASFGHKGVIFPLLVRAIGVLGSIWSTYTVKAGPDSTSDEALHSVHRGFVLGSIFSVVGFVLLGFGYLHFDKTYYAEYPQALGGAALDTAFEQQKTVFDEKNAELRKNNYDAYRTELKQFITDHQGSLFATGLPFWASFGTDWLDMRPAWTCMIGIILAIALNKVTSYYTHTQYTPVKSLAKSCQTGHATNIIQGFAVGYESAVVQTIVIAIAILLSALIYYGATPLFVAYGVAMCGIGMLTLTGNTISMDVFGPVADNANGIGEMGYDRKEMGEENYKRARQILADLDAVGNTTKAETKGIAIGSAVIAAVSLFASFIAILAVGSEADIAKMTTAQYATEAGKLVDRLTARIRRGFDRRRGSVPLQLDADSCRRPRRVLDRQGMPHAVPRQGDLGRHQEAGLRPRRQHLHRGGATRAGRPGLARDPDAYPGRYLPGNAGAGRLPGRDDHRRSASGGLHGQRRRCLG